MRRAEPCLRPLAVPRAGTLVVLSLASMMAWLTQTHPLALQPWEPWDFYWPAFLAVGFSLLWYRRGWRAAPRAARPSCWQCACFLLGVGAVYAVLLTRFDLLAQHMFFLNRVQHMVLHHFAPFLIALSQPGATLARGMPAKLLRACRSRPARRFLRIAQQPVIAVLLFEGLLMLWLIPPVMFRAMLDWRVYSVMNASMVLDGLLFWFLVLDPRPAPPAPTSFFARLAMAFVIIFPQIAIGTVIGLASYDIYPSFSLCGRMWAGIGPLLDQQIGGLVLWVPTGMMSAIAALLIMGRMFSHEDMLSAGAVRELS